jgi:putative restriction endonuclease
VTVDEEHRLVVGKRLREHFDNGRSYYDLDGHRLHLPAAAERRPSAEALTWHREQVFLG